MRGESPPSSSSPALSNEEARAALATPAHSFSERQVQAYLFDTLVLRTTPVHSGTPSLIEARSRFANSLGYPDFFAAYCAIRGIEADGVARLARRLLADTDHRYRIAFDDLFGGEISESSFSREYAGALSYEPERYSAEFVLTYSRQTIADLEMSESVSVVQGSPSGLSTNISSISPRRSTVFLDETGGLESFRAACHALGHALYSIQPEVGDEDLLGVNIAATELTAFGAQELALAGLQGRTQSLLELMPLYYARLYALKLLYEAELYRGGQVRDSVKERAEQLLITGGEPFAPSPHRLTAVDFVIGFAGYHEIGESFSSWEQVCGSAGTNVALLAGLGCLVVESDA